MAVRRNGCVQWGTRARAWGAYGLYAASLCQLCSGQSQVALRIFHHRCPVPCGPCPVLCALCPVPSPPLSSSLHFYNLKASLTQPQMLVVTELDDPFVPLPDDLLVNLRESRWGRCWGEGGREWGSQWWREFSSMHNHSGWACIRNPGGRPWHKPTRDHADRRVPSGERRTSDGPITAPSVVSFLKP